MFCKDYVDGGWVAGEQGQVGLVAKVASYLGSPHKEVAEGAREICKRFKKANTGSMPQVVITGLEHPYCYACSLPAQICMPAQI